jgi:hypothetical protein
LLGQLMGCEHGQRVTVGTGLFLELQRQHQLRCQLFHDTHMIAVEAYRAVVVRDP